MSEAVREVMSARVAGECVADLLPRFSLPCCTTHCSRAELRELCEGRGIAKCPEYCMADQQPDRCTARGWETGKLGVENVNSYEGKKVVQDVMKNVL